MLQARNLKVGRAWAIKEAVRTLWTYRQGAAVTRFFSQWYGWAVRSRLEPVKKVAGMLFLGGGTARDQPVPEHPLDRVDVCRPVWTLSSQLHGLERLGAKQRQECPGGVVPDQIRIFTAQHTKEHTTCLGEGRPGGDGAPELVVLAVAPSGYLGEQRSS